jgi:hypothetical protein
LASPAEPLLGSGFALRRAQRAACMAFGRFHWFFLLAHAALRAVRPWTMAYGQRVHGSGTSRGQR